MKPYRDEPDQAFEREVPQIRTLFQSVPFDPILDQEFDGDHPVPYVRENSIDED